MKSQREIRTLISRNQILFVLHVRKSALIAHSTLKQEDFDQNYFFSFPFVQ